MKIKKVEIQAFRAYDKVDNSTFDFKLQANDVADFISIYAPNGFGKTSFYDAVEWAYTNKIDRFERRHDRAELAKAERAIQTLNGKRDYQFIIRNKFSDKELPGYVRLFTTSSDEPIYNEIKKVRRGEPDYKIGREDQREGSENFQEVLLSQEWIDAFLKEDDPKDRYDKFMESFGDEKLNQRYKTIIDLIKINDSKILDLKNKIEGIQLDLNIDFDQEILTKINLAIEEVNKLGENLPRIDPNFTKTDELKFTNKLTERITTLKTQLEEGEKKLKDVQIIFSGKKDEIISLKKYYEKLQSHKSLQDQLTKLEAINKKIVSKNKIISEIKKIEETVSNLLQKQEKLVELIKIYPSYKKLSEHIVKEKNEVEKKKVAISEDEISLKSLNSEENELEPRITTLKKEIQNLEEQIEKIPKVFKAIKEGINERDEKSELLKKNIDSLTDMGEEIEKNLGSIKVLKKLQSQIFKSEEFPEYGDNIYVNKFWRLIKNLKHQLEKLAKTESDIQNITFEIGKIESLNEELSTLIELGSKIVDKEELSSCPLCSHEYESYSSLAERIAGNPLLEEAKVELLKKRTELEKEYKEKSNTFEDLREKALTKVKQEIKDLEKSNKDKKEVKDELESRIRDIKEEIAGLENKIKELRLEFDNKSKEEAKNKYSKELKSQKKVLSDLEDQLKDKKEAIKEREERIEYLKKEIDDANKRINSVQKKEDFKKIVDYKDEVLSETEIDLAELEKEKNQAKEKLNTNKERLEKLQDKLTNMEKELVSVNEKEVPKKVLSISKKIDELIDQINAFEQFLISKFDSKHLEKNEKQLEKFLNDERKKLSGNIDDYHNLILKLGQIKEYKENVIPFLEYQEKKETKNDLKKERKFLKQTIGTELEEERNRLSGFIHKQIESFFYQDLINELYAKIDPHPTYKDITFNCNFDDDRPSLNVFVSGSESNQPIAPSLYFSTAQLNILSLSIFLAKALNVEDIEGNPIDCIFIDDPIQSMDSINILSTIDLFRSIILNLDKQIILSTHDENFQNLLKKKIPPELFKSKFFELETFGKVKVDHA
ncbi:MAG: hypothetical protein WD607_06300 [Candidatus Paceibacterota bacterium]